MYHDAAHRLYHNVTHRLYHDAAHRLFHDVAHRLFHDVVHRLFHDVATDCTTKFFSSKTPRSLTVHVSYNFFHSRNKNRAFNVQNFTKPTNSRQHYMQISCTEFHPNRKISAECTYRNSFTPLHKAQFSLRRFRQDSLPLSITLWTSPVTNLTQVPQRMGKALAVIQLRYYVKDDSHFTDVQAACICSLELHRDLLYWL